MGAKMLFSIMVVISVYIIPITYAQSTGIATYDPTSKRSTGFKRTGCPLETYILKIGSLTVLAGDAVWKGVPQTCGTKYFLNCTGSPQKGQGRPCTGEVNEGVVVIGHCLAPNCSVDGFTFVFLSDSGFHKIAEYGYSVITIDYNSA